MLIKNIECIGEYIEEGRGLVNVDKVNIGFNAQTR